MRQSNRNYIVASSLLLGFVMGVVVTTTGPLRGISSFQVGYGTSPTMTSDSSATSSDMTPPDESGTDMTPPDESGTAAAMATAVAETEEEPVSIFQSILNIFRASLTTPAEEEATDRSVMEQGAEVQVTAEIGETVEEGAEETMEARISAMQEESMDALNAATPPVQAVAPEQTIEVAAFKMLGTATYSLFVEPFVTLFAMVFGW